MFSSLGHISVLGDRFGRSLRFYHLEFDEKAIFDFFSWHIPVFYGEGGLNFKWFRGPCLDLWDVKFCLKFLIRTVNFEKLGLWWTLALVTCFDQIWEYFYLSELLLLLYLTYISIQIYKLWIYKTCVYQTWPFKEMINYYLVGGLIVP